MLLMHGKKSPKVHKDAYIAPDATICGDVTIGAGARVMHGARIVAEGGRVDIGDEVIVMQNAVIRSTGTHDCLIATNALVGPTAHVVGATIEFEVFLATGTAIFHGSRIGAKSVVRIHGIVHVNTHLAAGTVVPIGWVAAGKPAELFSTDQADALWAVQEPLKFTRTAYGIDEPLNRCMKQVTRIVSDRLSTHRADFITDP